MAYKPFTKKQLNKIPTKLLPFCLEGSEAFPFIRAMADEPAEPVNYAALADWCEERGEATVARAARDFASALSDQTPMKLHAIAGCHFNRAVWSLINGNWMANPTGFVDAEVKVSRQIAAKPPCFIWRFFTGVAKPKHPDWLTRWTHAKLAWDGISAMALQFGHFSYDPKRREIVIHPFGLFLQLFWRGLE